MKTFFFLAFSILSLSASAQETSKLTIYSCPASLEQRIHSAMVHNMIQSLDRNQCNIVSDLNIQKSIQSLNANPEDFSSIDRVISIVTDSTGRWTTSPCDPEGANCSITRDDFTEVSQFLINKTQSLILSENLIGAQKTQKDVSLYFMRHQVNPERIGGQEIKTIYDLRNVEVVIEIQR